MIEVGIVDSHHISSAFAEKLVAPATNVIALPATMPVEFGALVEPLAVGYHALRRGDCGPGDTVLVIGGGPIGQSCALAAARTGAKAVVFSKPAAGRRGLIERIGADTVDPTVPGDLPNAVADALGGPPSLVVDAVGITATLASAFACAGLTSTIVLVGIGAPELRLSAFEVSTKERSVIGSFCYSAIEFGRPRNGSAPLLRLTTAAADLGLYWLEEALSPDDYWGYAELKRTVPKDTLVTTGEHEATRWGFQLLLAMECADIMQPDVGWCGGLSELLLIAEMADAHKVLVIPHGSSVYSYHHDDASQQLVCRVFNDGSRRRRRVPNVPPTAAGRAGPRARNPVDRPAGPTRHRFGSSVST